MTTLAAVGDMQDSKSGAVPLLRRPLPPSNSYLKAVFENGKRQDKRVSRSDPISEQKTPEARVLVVPPNTSQLASVVSPQCSSFVIHPLHPKGPPFLPPGKVLTQEPMFVPAELLALEHKWASNWPQNYNEFTFNDFLQTAKWSRESVVASQLQHPFISRENYLKMTSWFATHVPQQRHLHTVQIQGE